MDIRRLDPNKTLGGAPKPKFTPRLPAQSAVAVDIETKRAEPSTAETAIKQEQSKDSQKNANHVKSSDSYGGRGGQGGRGQPGGRGRGGRYQQPQSAPLSFFEGPRSMPTGSFKSTLPSSIGTGSGGYGITSQLQSVKQTEVVRVKKEVKSADSDDDDGPRSEAMDVDDVIATDAIWPPTEANHEEPVQIPFGPKSVSIWEHLAELPILAHPDDKAGILREENESVLLMQLPSTFILGDAAKKSKVKDEDDEMNEVLELPGSVEAQAMSSGDPNTKPKLSSQAQNFSVFLRERRLEAGKIGKLQLMQSGKVYFVTTDGLKYELHSGLTTCFSQYVTALATGNPTRDEESNLKSEAAGEAALYMLGAVSRKIVVSPVIGSNE